MKLTKNHLILGLSIYIAFVFIQSLFFKYTNSIETQFIFGTLDAWAGSLGFAGLFAPKGLFSQYVIGTAELFASTLLLFGLYKKSALLHAAGALVSMGVISGAIIFHLFTPLGVVILNDGGLLFTMACGVWLSAAIILYHRKDVILSFIKQLKK